jgi:hypothetical protein
MPKFSISSIKKEDIEGAIASGALITSAILPHGDIDGLNLCPHYYLTGQECPFCGMTRGFVAITHLDLKSALDFNLGTPLVYIAFVYFSLRSIIPRIVKGKEIQVPKPAYNIWLISTIAVFAVMAWERVIRHVL